MSLWAITSYFDPLGTKARLANYHEFRRRLQVPLAAVELAFGDSFELGPGDADILIQRRGGSLLWQKERLLNLALDSLPDECDTVAWVDADVIFRRDDWARAACLELKRSALVQPFRRLFHLSKQDRFGDERGLQPLDVRWSFASLAAEGRLPDAAFNSQGSSVCWRYAPGMAWVARRSTFAKAGLYDALILGSGDKTMVSAAIGRCEDSMHAFGMNRCQEEHYRNWAEPFFAAVGGRISFIEGDVLHLWHGSIGNRHHADRYDGFDRFEFNPFSDIARNGDGVWKWNSDKPGLHAFTRRYFERRKDGQ